VVGATIVSNCHCWMLCSSAITQVVNKINGGSGTTQCRSEVDDTFVAVTAVHSVCSCGILFVAILWGLAGLAGMIIADVKTMCPAIVC
jgi:hypothetical protein